MMALLLAVVLGYGPTSVRTYDEGGNEIRRREPTVAERDKYREVLEVLRESRSLRIPEHQLSASALCVLAGKVRPRELRPAQWTVGNCNNLDHYPQIWATVPRFERLATALEGVDPRWLSRGSHFCPKRRCWIVGESRPVEFQRPQTTVHGSFQPDDRIPLPDQKSSCIE